MVYDKVSLDDVLKQILENSPNAPVFSIISGSKQWDVNALKEILNECYTDGNPWPEILANSYENNNDASNLLLSSFAGIVSHLKKILIADQILTTARYEHYDPQMFKKTRMILDSQALQHLDVLEVEYFERDRYSGSLLNYIDKTVTKFGKRQLRKWICAPLMSVGAINERLTAVEDFEFNWETRNLIRDEFRKWPDFERLCGRIYTRSVKKEENFEYFEDMPVQQLREFKKLINSLDQANIFLTKLAEEAMFGSTLLQSLTTLVDYELVNQNKASAGMPDIGSILKEISDFVEWEGNDKSIPTPKQGIDKDYDAVKAEVESLGSQFNEYLEEVRKEFDGDKMIRFVHIKHRYELEIPVELVGGTKKPPSFEFTSRRKGYERFITQRIRDLLSTLEEAEDRLKNLLSVYVCFVFKHFHSYHRVWDRFINNIAQLDCLSSLSVVSFQSDGVMCRPEVFDPSGRDPFMDVRNLRHPVLSLRTSGFVPNDVILGTERGRDESRSLMFLTGPNMGGKSTILRQVCIAAILAQIGCYVPADSCRMSLVDRIFTRIGASDRLVQGKSTFYIEMEETLNIVEYGSKNSLAIIDELGRGTTTFDGIAIAYAVLGYIMNQLKCRVFFATHYHILLEEFRDSLSVGSFHMTYKLDEENEKVIFLYKLIEGECSKSFGLNIAKIVGLSPDIVARAKEKADEFEKNFNLREFVSRDKAFEKILPLLQGVDDEVEEKLEKLEDIIKTLSKQS